MKVTQEMTINELLSSFPEDRVELIAKYLIDLGMHCLGCPSASFESLEEGLLNHGFDNKKIDEIIKDLNKIVE
jgi:hybrid cluster-associated redox disulfide protein